MIVTQIKCKKLVNILKSNKFPILKNIYFKEFTIAENSIWRFGYIDNIFITDIFNDYFFNENESDRINFDFTLEVLHHNINKDE